MEIRKRNGESVPFQQEKIFNAMKKAFDGQGREIGSRELNEILAAVLDNLSVAVAAHRGTCAGRGGADAHGARTL